MSSWAWKADVSRTSLQACSRVRVDSAAISPHVSVCSFPWVFWFWLRFPVWSSLCSCSRRLTPLASISRHSQLNGSRWSVWCSSCICRLFGSAFLVLARSHRAAAFSDLFCSGSFGCSVTSVSVVSAFSDVLAVSFCCAWWFCSSSFCWPWCQCSQKLIIPMSLFQFFNSNFKIKCKFQRVLLVFFEMTWTFWMNRKNPRNRTKMEKGVNKTYSKNRLFWCLVLYF